MLIEEERVAGQAARPIANGWQVRCEPLAMRNCTNAYLANCLAGTARLFATPDEFGNQVGTIDLTRRGKVWGRRISAAPPTEPTYSIWGNHDCHREHALEHVVG